MAFFKFNDIKIAGISSAVPKNIIKLDSFNDIFGEEDVAKFTKMTGVKQFHKASKLQTASDLGFVAAKEMINKKQIDVDEIGILVFVSKTPDYPVPATACVLHKRLGLSKDCIAFDINLGCSGFVYGMQVVCSLLESVNTKYALLIVGDTTSKIISPLDRSVAMLVGDGTSAIIFEKNIGEKPINVQTRSNGEGFKSIIIPAGGYRIQDVPDERTEWGDGNIRSDFELYMNGTEVFSFTISEVPEIIKEYMSKNQITIEDVDCFAIHQVNEFIIKQIAKKAKIPIEKVPMNIYKYGNTSGNSVPLLLSDLYGVNEGQNIRIIACCFGVGLSWGIADFVLNINDIMPVIETEDYYTEGQVSHE